MTYQPWAAGEPNNLYKDDRCISLSAFHGHQYAWNDERCYIDWIDDLDLPVYFICQFSKLISIMTHLKLSMINSPGTLGRFSKKSNKNLVKILMQVVIVDPYYVKSFMLGQKSKHPYLINSSA